MHDLARCVVSAGDRALDGYVAAMVDGTMTIGTELRGAHSYRAGDDVTILVLDEVRGEVRYDGTVVRVGPTMMQVGRLQLTSMLQKRSVSRVTIAQMCTGVVQADDDPRPLTFVVLNLGAHGMRIATTARLALRETIAFRFPVGDDGAVELEAEVLRAQRTRSGSTHYGCRFVGVDELVSDALFRYVLRVQGAQRRTRLPT